ncbi:MAG TPA: DUF4388 domain-containing protein [Thermoanaerobaculia bacterium]|nr:DUF4388 domain-containing protein [Thermoanaerobaculia bacterium]
MSLLGRLEDLSLPDIIQIVYLSRRTGALEVINASGRHRILFRKGLVVNASSPQYPDLVTYLHERELVAPPSVPTLRRLLATGIPAGTAVVELHLVNRDDLSSIIRQRILDVIAPLLQSKEGEFHFALSESLSAADIEYEPDMVSREGGFPPQKLLATGEGERLKPLQGLEDALRPGRGAQQDSPPAAELPGESAVPPSPVAENVVPFPGPDPESPSAAPSAADDDPRRSPAQFRVAGGLFEIEHPETAHWNVLLYERNALLRVAVKRTFGKRGVRVAQYGDLDDVRTAVNGLVRSNAFFIALLELPEDRTEEEAVVRLVQHIKRLNPRIPVAVMDENADGRRRHEVVAAGANVYLRKPASGRLQPAKAEEQLSLFADELLLLSERAFRELERLAGGHDPEAASRFYELAARDNLDRRFSLLERLITELSDPNDIHQVSATILRLADDYLDRGALFLITASEFVGLGGFGVTGEPPDMDERVRGLRIGRGAASILAEVAESRLSRRGKMRRTPANVALMQALGTLVPTQVVVLPILQGGYPIGILYGDNAEHRGPIESLTGLEIFLSQTGSAFGSAAEAWERAAQE